MNFQRIVIYVLMLISLTFWPNVRAFSQNTNWDVLNPLDDSGNPWFETKNEKVAYFDEIISTMKADGDNQFLSVRDDLLVCNAKIRDDDAQSYDHLVVVKGNYLSSKAHINEQFGAGSLAHYEFYFYVGPNISTASFEISEDVFENLWHSDNMTNIISSIDLLAIDGDATIQVGEWFHKDTMVLTDLRFFTLTGN